MHQVEVERIAFEDFEDEVNFVSTSHRFANHPQHAGIDVRFAAVMILDSTQIRFWAAEEQSFGCVNFAFAHADERHEGELGDQRLEIWIGLAFGPSIEPRGFAIARILPVVFKIHRTHMIQATLGNFEGKIHVRGVIEVIFQIILRIFHYIFLIIHLVFQQIQTIFIDGIPFIFFISQG